MLHTCERPESAEHRLAPTLSAIRNRGEEARGRGAKGTNLRKNCWQSPCGSTGKELGRAIITQLIAIGGRISTKPSQASAQGRPITSGRTVGCHEPSRTFYGLAISPFPCGHRCGSLASDPLRTPSKNLVPNSPDKPHSLNRHPPSSFISPKKICPYFFCIPPDPTASLPGRWSAKTPRSAPKNYASRHPWHG